MHTPSGGGLTQLAFKTQRRQYPDSWLTNDKSALARIFLAFFLLPMPSSPRPKRTETLRVARRDSKGKLAMLERQIETSDMAPRLNHAEKHAQATAIMMSRLFQGIPTNALAEAYGVSSGTILARLRLARKDGVPAEAREIIIRDMLPAAMAVILDTLGSEDRKLALQAAKMVVEGLDAMRNPESLPEPSSDPTGGTVVETLEAFREKVVKKTYASNPNPPQLLPGDSFLTLDALPVPPSDPSNDA